MSVTEIGTNLSEVIGWVGSVVSALTATDGKLAPLASLLMIGISVSAFMLAIKAIRSFIWGA